jgi:peroxiredoxin
MRSIIPALCLLLLAAPLAAQAPIADTFTQMQTDLTTALNADDADALWAALQRYGLHRMLRVKSIDMMKAGLTPGSQGMRQLREFTSFELLNIQSSGDNQLLTVKSPLRGVRGPKITLTFSPNGDGWNITDLRTDQGLSMSSKVSKVPEAGGAAPDFTLKDAAGKDVSLSDFRGKAVVLNFWATWCPPCRAEIPMLESNWQKLQNKGVVVLGINAEDDIAKAKKFVTEHMTYPNLFGAANVNAQYGVVGVPATFYIDKTGVVRHHIVGSASESEAVIAERVKAMME